MTVGMISRVECFVASPLMIPNSSPSPLHRPTKILVVGPLLLDRTQFDKGKEERHLSARKALLAPHCLERGTKALHVGRFPESPVNIPHPDSAGTSRVMDRPEYQTRTAASFPQPTGNHINIGPVLPFPNAINMDLLSLLLRASHLGKLHTSPCLYHIMEPSSQVPLNRRKP